MPFQSPRIPRGCPDGERIVQRCNGQMQSQVCGGVVLARLRTPGCYRSTTKALRLLVTERQIVGEYSPA